METPMIDDGAQPLYSWLDFQMDALELVRQITESGIKFDRIIAVPRGGLVLGTVLSHAFAVPLVVRDYREPTDPPACLVVDDNAITGTTFERFFDGRFAFAVLVKHPNARMLSPNFCARESDEMYLFPWEAMAPNAEFTTEQIVAGD